MNPVVVKFGGSSFRKVESYRSVCEIITGRLRARRTRLVVVVSAMYGHTDRLLAAARSLSPEVSGEASDLLLTAGETISASLLKIALDQSGVRATVLNAYRLGILSDSNFTQAAIRSVDAAGLRRAMADSEVVVVTGAQAVDQEGRITMLGRNSSDLTAVALAGALGLEECEIYSDVPGVYSADPNLFQDARLLPRVPHWQIIEMSRCGAKVIHFGAAECARRLGVRIVCRATRRPEKIGTVIGGTHCSAPALILNEKAAFFEFDSAAGLEEAESRLSAWGAAAVRVQRAGAPMLAVTQGVLSVQEFLQGLSVSFRHIPGCALIARITDAGHVEKAVVEAAVARALANRYHDEICSSLPPVGVREDLFDNAGTLAGARAMVAARDASFEPDLLPLVANLEN